MNIVNKFKSHSLSNQKFFVHMAINFEMILVGKLWTPQPQDQVERQTLDMY